VLAPDAVIVAAVPAQTVPDVAVTVGKGLTVMAAVAVFTQLSVLVPVTV
jgi:hypothetical protein